VTVVVETVGKAGYHATVKKESMNKIKQWVFGVALLVASPFLLLFAMLVGIMIKLPIFIFMLYNETWQEHKNKGKEQ
jgi:hypothetical protein